MLDKLFGLFKKDVSGKSSESGVESSSSKSSSATKLPMHINIGHELGLSVLSKTVLASSKKNHIVSPLSLCLALALLHEGSSEDTKSEIEAKLEVQDYAERFDATMSQLARHISKRLNNPQSDNLVSVANGLFVSKKYGLPESYLDKVEALFDSHIEELEFSSSSAASSINRWVSESTRGKISGIIDKTHPDDRCYLLNAIYLLCTWEHPFDEVMTKQEPFHLLDGSEVIAPQMKKLSKYKYLKTKHYEIVEIPYKKNEYSMLVVLPKSNDRFETVIESLDKKEFLSSVKKMERKKVRLYLPKFKVEHTLELNEVLKDLGFKHIFESTSDEYLFASRIIQKTFVDVDETGTEAAAVTAIQQTFAAPPGKRKPPPIIEMKVERPFVFAIKHESTNSLLFLGAVADPTK